MDIKNLMQQLHDAPDGQTKEKVIEKIKSQFASLGDSEKEEVRKVFTASWDEKLEYTGKKLEEIDLKLEMMEISKYISFAQIAKNYFGKSKYWLYQRISQWNVNGKPAKFTEEERKKLSLVLHDLAEKLENTSFKIA
jgi:hypothetical protein